MTKISTKESNTSFTIESINPKNISEQDLEKITEIEQDMWAREDGIGEYIKCTSCNKIHSKEDVYLHMTNDLKVQTVAKIEEALQIKKIPCISCHGKTEFIYDRNDYIEDIRNRYCNSVESFLTVFRDSKGEIRGFMDGYIDKFDKVYNEEFKKYYDNVGKDFLIKIIEEKLGNKIPDDILACSSLGIEEKYKNFLTVLKIMKHFFLSIDKKNRDILGITELELSGHIHNLHVLLGSKSLGIGTGNNLISNKNNKFTSDIFINPTLVEDYQKELSIPLREFISRFKSHIRGIKN